MSSLLLVDALVAELQSILKDYRSSPDPDSRTPRVFAGWVPLQEYVLNADYGPSLEDFPCVVVRPISGIVQGRSALLTVRIYCGAYDDDIDQAWRSSLAISQRIWQHLLAMPTLGKVFRMERTPKWNMEEEQPWPQCLVMLETQWSQALPHPNYYPENPQN